MSLAEAFSALEPGRETSAYDPLRLSRYRLDPPEFLTVLHGPVDGLHWGYYVDDPADADFAVASYYHSDTFELRTVGYTLFDALRAHLEQTHRDLHDAMRHDPAQGDVYRRHLDDLDRVRDVLGGYATGDRAGRGAEYLGRYPVRRDVTAPTRDGMGIVAPPALYREPEGAGRFEDPSFLPAPPEATAYRQAGLDALAGGFPGTALKVGKDLWLYPENLGPTYDLLDSSYAALGREPLRKALSVSRQGREAELSTPN